MAEPVGFFTDTTVCIGCKACQVACKEWNDLPAKLGDKPARHPGVGSTPRGESPGAYSDPGNLKKRPERVSNKA